MQLSETRHVAESSSSLPNRFEALGLSRVLVRALAEEGYETPTPIQAGAIPTVLSGRDLLGAARTGTGKTAAFLLPLLDRLARSADRKRLRILVLSPTRELASQIHERAQAYGKHMRLRSTVVFGGVNIRTQMRALSAGVEMLVATPGRLLDLLDRNAVRLDSIDMFVLDEADRMLDIGFLPAIRRIVAMLPKDRQTLLFSATMPKVLAGFAQSILSDPAKVSVADPEEKGEIRQSIRFVGKGEKRSHLQDYLAREKIDRAIVFTRTKRGANRVTEQLVRAGFGAAAIHGNKSQNARERALEGFRTGTLPVLVATDVAARGIDVKGVSHVINYELPDTAECYVHRIGRTGRAGTVGTAISFCDAEERAMVSDIERLMAMRIPVDRSSVAPLAVMPDQPARPEAPGEAPAAPRSRNRRRRYRPR